MNNTLKHRNSSIELLRIICMLLIVIYHYHARDFNLYVVASDRVCEYDMLPKLILHSLGKLGVPIFVFISGWYGLKFKKKRFLEMLSMCAFYAVLCVVGCFLFYEENKIKQVFFFVNLWWFMTAYLCLYILSPGINYLFNTLGKHQTFILSTVLTYIAFGGVFLDSGDKGGLFLMFSMFFCARWLKLYASVWLDRWWCIILVAVLVVRIGTIIVGFFTGHLGVLPFINSYVNPLTIILVAAIFVGFTKIIFSSVIVNKLASCSLAVYLCSESDFGKKVFDGWFPHENWNLFHYVVASVSVYLTISIIDQLRKYITDNLVVRIVK